MEKLRGFNPIKLAEKIRPRMIDLKNKKVLLACFVGTSQAKDIPERQIRNNYFRVKQYEWPDKTKKGIHLFRSEPAGIATLRLNESLKKYSKKNPISILKTKECNSVFLFQINGCNLNCWQCYVDDINKSANPKYGKFFSAEEILMEFLAESRKTSFITDPNKKVNILRISGGDPFLVPEIIVWIIEALEKFGLEDYVYLWVDTNLSTGTFYWKYLSLWQKEKIRNFKNIGFMGCYKGCDEESFIKTCGASPEFFKEQFLMHRRLIEEGLDVYSYYYPLIYSSKNLKKRLSKFMDRLQEEVNLYAPLRLTTPETKVFYPTKLRMNPEREKSLNIQFEAIKIWKKEMKKRFGKIANTPPHLAPIK